jgi:hypothetical protein
VTDLDLFGNPEPVRKRDGDYLIQLSQKPYPEGLVFWCLSADPRPKRFPAESTEMVVFSTGTYWLHCAININTGQILEQVRKQPIRNPRKRGRKKASPTG